MSNDINKSWLPIIAGIFDITIGALILLILVTFGIGSMVGLVNAVPYQVDLSSLFLIAPATVISSLAIIGGIFAIRKSKWRVALAGSIAAAIFPIPLGLASIVMLALAKKEFRAVQ